MGKEGVRFNPRWPSKVYGNAHDYAEQQLKSDPALKRDMVVITYSYSAEKVGTSKDYDAVRQAVLAPYLGKANGVIYPNPDVPGAPGVPIQENGYFHDPRAWINQGYWSWKNLADQLPYDYMPGGQ